MITGPEDPALAKSVQPSSNEETCPDQDLLREWLLKALQFDVDTKGVLIDTPSARERLLAIPTATRLGWGTAFIVAVEAVVGPRNDNFFTHCFFYFAAFIALAALYGMRSIHREQSLPRAKAPGLIMAGVAVTLAVLPLLMFGEPLPFAIAVFIVIASFKKAREYEPQHSATKSSLLQSFEALKRLRAGV